MNIGVDKPAFLWILLYKQRKDGYLNDLIKKLYRQNKIAEIYRLLEENYIHKNTLPIKDIIEDINLALILSLKMKDLSEFVRLYNLFSEVHKKISNEINDLPNVHIDGEKDITSIEELLDEKNKFLLYINIIYHAIKDDNYSIIDIYLHKIKKLPVNNISIEEYPYIVDLLMEINTKDTDIFKTIKQKISPDSKMSAVALYLLSLENNYPAFLKKIKYIIDDVPNYSPDEAKIFLKNIIFFMVEKRVKENGLWNKVFSQIEKLDNIDYQMEILLFLLGNIDKTTISMERIVKKIINNLKKIEDKIQAIFYMDQFTDIILHNKPHLTLDLIDYIYNETQDFPDKYHIIKNLTLLSAASDMREIFFWSTQSMEKSKDKAFYLEIFAEGLYRAGEKNKRIWKDLTQAISESKEAYNIADIMTFLHLLGIKDDEIWKPLIYKALQDQYDVKSIAHVLAEAGIKDREIWEKIAFNLSKEIEKSQTSLYMLIIVLKKIINLGLGDLIIDLLKKTEKKNKKIKNLKERLRSALRLAEAFFLYGDFNSSYRLLSETEKEVDRIKDEYDRMGIYIEMLKTLILLNMREDAQNLLEAIYEFYYETSSILYEEKLVRIGHLAKELIEQDNSPISAMNLLNLDLSPPIIYVGIRSILELPMNKLNTEIISKLISISHRLSIFDRELFTESMAYIIEHIVGTQLFTEEVLEKFLEKFDYDVEIMLNLVKELVRRDIREAWIWERIIPLYLDILKQPIVWLDEDHNRLIPIILDIVKEAKTYRTYKKMANQIFDNCGNCKVWLLSMKSIVKRAKKEYIYESARKIQQFCNDKTVLFELIFLLSKYGYRELAQTIFHEILIDERNRTIITMETALYISEILMKQKQTKEGEKILTHIVKQASTTEDLQTKKLLLLKIADILHSHTIENPEFWKNLLFLFMYIADDPIAEDVIKMILEKNTHQEVLEFLLNLPNTVFKYMALSHLAKQIWEKGGKDREKKTGEVIIKTLFMGTSSRDHEKMPEFLYPIIKTVGEIATDSKTIWAIIEEKYKSAKYITEEAEIMFMIIEAYSRMGKTSRSRTLLKKVAKTLDMMSYEGEYYGEATPETIEKIARSWAGAVFKRKKNIWEKILQIADGMIEEDRIKSYLSISYYMKKSGEVKLSEEVYSKAIELINNEKNMIDFYLQIIKKLYQTEYTEKAEELLNEYLNIISSHTGADQLYFISLLVDALNEVKAQMADNLVKRITPLIKTENEEFVIKIIMLLLRNKDYENAWNIIEKYLENKNISQSHIIDKFLSDLICEYFIKGEYDKSIEIYEKIITGEGRQNLLIKILSYLLDKKRVKKEEKEHLSQFIDIYMEKEGSLFYNTIE